MPYGPQTIAPELQEQYPNINLNDDDWIPQVQPETAAQFLEDIQGDLYDPGFLQLNSDGSYGWVQAPDAGLQSGHHFGDLFNSGSYVGEEWQNLP